MNCWKDNSKHKAQLPNHGGIKSLLWWTKGSYASNYITIHSTWRLNIFDENPVRYAAVDIADLKSKLWLVMAGYCQATSSYLNWRWLISIRPYHTSRPQWVNIIPPSQVSRQPAKSSRYKHASLMDISMTPMEAFYCHNGKRPGELDTSYHGITDKSHSKINISCVVAFPWKAMCTW